MYFFGNLGNEQIKNEITWLESSADWYQLKPVLEILKIMIKTDEMALLVDKVPANFFWTASFRKQQYVLKI